VGNCNKETCEFLRPLVPDDSDVPSNPLEGCCNGEIIITTMQCCDNLKVKPIWPIANIEDPQDCPNRTARIPPRPPNGCTPFGIPADALAILYPQCAAIGQAPSFTSACNQHDIDFDTCGFSKEAANAAFGSNLNAICARIPGEFCGTACYALAGKFVSVVSSPSFSSFYNSAQTAVCQCCPSP
jgi:hypothetical protein